MVAFKGQRDPDIVFLRDKENQQVNDNKLKNNISRARSMVLQYALCNPWDFFFTGTLAKTKYDRFNLDVFSSSLTQFMRDQRKKWDAAIQYLLVPEHHQNGAWHIHGLVNGLPHEALGSFSDLEKAPLHLIEGGFSNWPDYMKKFGFCSMAPVRDPVATAFYITKYISKDLSERAADLHRHLYFHSRPLKKAKRAADVYAYNRQLDTLCTEDFEFVKTGWAEGEPYDWRWICNLDY